MRVVLKKNKVFDKISYLKDDIFVLRGVHWTDLDDSSEMYYVESTNGNRHEVERNLFDFDCRDLKRNT
jgi:hypothetical protein